MVKLVHTQALGTCGESLEGSTPSIRIMTLEEQMQPELDNWKKNIHSLELWLPLSKKLALAIDANVPGALEFRDKLLESVSK